MHSTEADAKDGSATYAQIVLDKCASHAAQSLSDSWLEDSDVWCSRAMRAASHSM
jgi:hypothetical protein